MLSFSRSGLFSLQAVRRPLTVFRQRAFIRIISDPGDQLFRCGNVRTVVLQIINDKLDKGSRREFVDAVQAEALQRHQRPDRIVLCPGGDAAVISLEMAQDDAVQSKAPVDVLVVCHMAGIAATALEAGVLLQNKRCDFVFLRQFNARQQSGSVDFRRTVLDLAGDFVRHFGKGTVAFPTASGPLLRAENYLVAIGIGRDLLVSYAQRSVYDPLHDFVA